MIQRNHLQINKGYLNTLVANYLEVIKACVQLSEYVLTPTTTTTTALPPTIVPPPPPEQKKQRAAKINVGELKNQIYNTLRNK